MRTGYVTARPGARPHLAVNGLAHCGAGSGRITGETTDLTPAIAADLCRRCRRRAEVVTTDELHTAQRRREPRRADRANRILDALELPATRARVADLAAHVRGAARARITANRPARPLSGLGALAAAHRDALARDRQAAGQLVLI